jgi:hypothetical protein
MAANLLNGGKVHASFDQISNCRMAHHMGRNADSIQFGSNDSATKQLVHSVPVSCAAGSWPGRWEYPTFLAVSHFKLTL